MEGEFNMKRSLGAKQKLNKKALTLAGVAILLVGAVAVNLFINRDKSKLPASDQEDAVAASAAATGFFESYRKDRESTRAQEIQYIDAIIAQGADADTLADAQQQKLNIVDNMEKEMTVENLLKAKGFRDAAVSLHTGAVNVIIDADELTDEQVAQVLDIVIRETGETAENVKVTTAGE